MTLSEHSYARDTSLSTAASSARSLVKSLIHAHLDTESLWRCILSRMLFEVIILAYDAVISDCVHAMPLVDVRCMLQWWFS